MAQRKSPHGKAGPAQRPASKRRAARKPVRSIVNQRRTPWGWISSPGSSPSRSPRRSSATRRPAPSPTRAPRSGSRTPRAFPGAGPAHARLAGQRGIAPRCRAAPARDRPGRVRHHPTDRRAAQPDLDECQRLHQADPGRAGRTQSRTRRGLDHLQPGPARIRTRAADGARRQPEHAPRVAAGLGHRPPGQPAHGPEPVAHKHAARPDRAQLLGPPGAAHLAHRPAPATLRRHTPTQPEIHANTRAAVDGIPAQTRDQPAKSGSAQPNPQPNPSGSASSNAAPSTNCQGQTPRAGRNRCPGSGSSYGHGWLLLDGRARSRNRRPAMRGWLRPGQRRDGRSCRDNAQRPVMSPCGGP